MHLGETLVDADEAEVAIKETEADRNSVVDGVELGEALGGKGFEAQRQVGVGGCGGTMLARCVFDFLSMLCSSGFRWVRDVGWCKKDRDCQANHASQQRLPGA